MIWILPGVVQAADPSSDDTRVYKQAIELLAQGKQAAAERLVRTQVRKSPSVSMKFFDAVLCRSRFDIDGADQLFEAVNDADPQGTDGQAAGFIIAIDTDRRAVKNFIDLDNLSAAHPEDPLLLWMVAVECRQLHKSKIGIERYNKLLQVLYPGPSLVHQTFGNLLMEDRQYEKALEQFDLSIQLEPAAWGYNCKGNAMWALGHIDQATAAYQKAIELDPNYELAWSNWADLCDAQDDEKGAAEKRAKLKDIQDRRIKGN